MIRKNTLVGGAIIRKVAFKEVGNRNEILITSNDRFACYSSTYETRWPSTDQ